MKILKRPTPNFANSFGSLILFILLLCLTARVTYAQQKDFSFSHPPSSFYDQIDPEKLYNTLQDIASPAFMGRELGTSGNIKAVDWLDFKFRDIGLEPIFNTSFKQGFPVASYQLGETNNLTVSDSTFELFTHFVPAYFSDSDQVRATLFWAGNMDEVNANVASGMAGKIVAIWQDSTKMGMPYAAPLEKIRKAESFGAEAVVLITPPGRKSSHSATGSPYRFEEFIQLPQKAEQTMDVVPSPFVTPQSLSIPVIYASKKILPLLYNQLEDRRTSVYELRKGDLSADTVALQTSVEIQERKQAFNVVGLLEGTAPSTERKAVILGAHFDQQGLHSSGMPMLGANRNAAATSALLEIARILAQADQKPHHDIIFAGWNGAERNAAGLTYFLDNMPMPDESVAGVINLLEIAGSRLSDTVHVYTEIPKQHDKLQAAATQAGDVFGYKLQKRTDNDADSGIYDFQLIPIARRNIPAMSISGGYYSLGNRIIDSADKLNYNQLYNITHFTLELTWNMAHPVSSN